MTGSPRASLVTNAALTYGTNVTAAVLSLTNVLIVARTLGPSGRGDVAFLIAIAMLTSNLAAFGIQEANANIGGIELALRPALATNSVIFALVFGALAAGIVFVLTTVFPAMGGEVARTWLYITLAAIPVVILKLYLQFLAQADYSFSVTNLAWVVGPLTTAVSNGVLAGVGALSVGGAITAWIVGQTIGATILLSHVRRRSGFAAPNALLARRCLGFGVKTHVGRFMTLGNYRVDQWFVGAISGSRELGYYSVAVAWAEVLYYIPGVLVLVQRPDLVRASKELAARLATRVFRIALILAVVVAGMLALAAPILCIAVFGAPFSNSVDDLRLLSLAAFGIVALELLGGALTAQLRPLRASAAIAAAFVVTISLDILLIPLYGGAGAAAATSLAATVGGTVMMIVFVRTLATPAREFVPRVGDVVSVYDHLHHRLRKGASALPTPPP